MYAKPLSTVDIPNLEFSTPWSLSLAQAMAAYPVVGVEAIGQLPDVAVSILGEFIEDIKHLEQNRIGAGRTRDLDFVAGMGGNQAMVAELTNRGFNARVATCSSIQTTTGFIDVIDLVLRVRRGGMVWMWAEPTWYTQSGRTVMMPVGDESNRVTHHANNQLHRIAALVLLTLLRQVHISFESYDGLIAKVEPLYSVCEWAKEFSKHGTVEIVTYMGAFGHVD
jgi:hypothetical protein